MLPFRTDRPLVVFDIESTGTGIRTDRIIELCALRIDPDGTETSKTWRINPGMPIPKEATAVHGITDDDVRDCPRFEDLSLEIMMFFGNDHDLAGYNAARFDIPMLIEEFGRAGIPFKIDVRRILDAQRIYHAKEPRDLSAALRFYCGREHHGAHGAEADVRATWDVIKGQFVKYADLPKDMDGLDRAFNPVDPLNADRAGRLRWLNGEIVINFGKKKGCSLRKTIAEDASFIKWIIKNEFPQDTRKICEDALKGVYPTPPEN